MDFKVVYPQVIVPNDWFGLLQEDEKEYWHLRCKLAEALLNITNSKDNIFVQQLDLYKEWEKIHYK